MAAPQDILQEQWDFYKEVYGPAEEDLSAQVQAGVPVDAQQKQAKSDIQQAYARQQGIQDRQASRYGVAPAQPEAQARSLAMIRRAAEIGAGNGLRQDASDTQLSRLSSMTNLGQGIPMEAATGMTAGNAMRNAMKRSSDIAKQALVNAGIQTAYTVGEGMTQNWGGMQDSKSKADNDWSNAFTPSGNGQTSASSINSGRSNGGGLGGDWMNFASLFGSKGGSGANSQYFSSGNGVRIGNF